MIEILGLTKRFHDRTILDNISATFAKGETVALIGPSGGGKSTLLRCLNGLEAFDVGSVKVGDDVVGPGGFANNQRALSAIRQRLGFVFQQWNLFAHRTALGNVVEAPMVVKGISHAAAHEKARALLERVGLSHRERAYPHEMSGGEQQRVAIARALAMEPEGLLMDEPTSALDPERVGDVLELMEKLTGDGLTMLVVTHEMKFARNCASRVLVLHGGRIIEDGRPGDVLVNPSHERTRAFLGMDGSLPPPPPAP